jgi:hypothetical protein
MKSLIDQER